MSKISDIFQENSKALLVFFAAGDPGIDETVNYALTAEKAGADAIIIGIPFSDPITEGLAAQAANNRALINGFKIGRVFDAVSRIREKSGIPLILSTYINPVFNYGIEKFMQNSRESGVNGLIVPDIPFEERGEISQYCSANGLDFITPVAPAAENRVEKIVKNSEGFLNTMFASKTDDIKSEFDNFYSVIRKYSDLPIVLDFEVLSDEAFDVIKNYVGGFIVSGPIIKAIEQYNTEAGKPITELIKELKEKFA